MNCQCGDPRCPVCAGDCHAKGTVILCRIDMDDDTGTLFCDKCAQDALASGFYSE